MKRFNKVTSFRLTPELMIAIGELARSQDVSKGVVIRSALKAYFGRRGEIQPTGFRGRSTRFRNLASSRKRMGASTKCQHRAKRHFQHHETISRQEVQK